jgi:hypothetical protein
MDLGAQLEGCLRALASGCPVEVREAGARLALLPELSWEVRGNASSPLLHLWSEQLRLTRRVIGIAEDSADRLALSVQRFGSSKPDRLEFIRLEFERPPRDLRREEFSARLRNVLAQAFPDEELESLSVAADLEHSLSGNYARGSLRRGSSRWAVLAVQEGESAATSENALTFGLLWLNRVRETNRRGQVEGLRLILPAGESATAAHRTAALDPRLRIDLLEYNAERETIEKSEVLGTENLRTWLVPAREAESLLAQALPALEPIVANAPSAISAHALAETGEVWLRFRGLAFVRWEEGRIYFGLDGAREELTAATRPALEELLHGLDLHRTPLASDTRHALYRAHAERWLEANIFSDITRVDAALNPDFVYSQVFAATAADGGILDLLSVTRAGRLAILELKAGEHIHLPLQAAEYWLRVRHHQLRGDFTRYGYFRGVELQSAPPLVYLVAPALRFHPSTDALLRFLSPEIEVIRVGLAENWRRGLRVVMRQ